MYYVFFSFFVIYGVGGSWRRKEVALRRVADDLTSVESKASVRFLGI